MTKSTRARYTLEFKQEAVRLVGSGQSIAAAARSLGVVEQTLFNWVKASREGMLKGADSSNKTRRLARKHPPTEPTGDQSRLWKSRKAKTAFQLFHSHDDYEVHSVMGYGF